MSDNPHQLKRVIGVGALALTMMNSTIGAGIFGLPAFASHALGTAAIAAYLACLLLVALVGLCLAEAGSRMPLEGGLYAYADASFGRYVGAVAGHLLWFGEGVAANAAVAVLMVDTLGFLVPALHAVFWRTAILIAYYVVLVVVNVGSARQGAWLSQLTSLIKLLPLVALVIFGLPHMHAANLHFTMPPSFRALGDTTVLLFFAFMGFEASLAVGEELVTPERTIPRAIAISVLLVGALYIGLQIVSQGVLGPMLANAGEAPLRTVADVAFGSVGGKLILLATVLSTAGLVASDMLVSPRVLFALARDASLPKFLGRTNEHGTPGAAIVTYCGICALLALSGTFRALASLSAAATLLLYLIVVLGLFRLRARNVQAERQPFIVPGGPLVPLAAAAVVIGVLAGLGWSDFRALAIFVAIALVVAWLYRRTAHAEA
ncbi:MAG: APC family permease [Gemmatimonadales bacterium]